MNHTVHHTIIGDSLIRRLTPKEISCPNRVITIQSFPGKTLRFVRSELQKNHLSHLFFPVDIVTYILGTNDLFRTSPFTAFNQAKELIRITHNQYPGVQIQIFTVPAHLDTLISTNTNHLQKTNSEI